MPGEAASADTEAASGFCDILKMRIAVGGYNAKQVLNMNEIGLFWKNMSKRTYVSWEEKSAPGFKAAKERVTVVLVGNNKGDLKLMLLVIDLSLGKPKGSKGVHQEPA